MIPCGGTQVGTVMRGRTGTRFGEFVFLTLRQLPRTGGVTEEYERAYPEYPHTYFFFITVSGISVPHARMFFFAEAEDSQEMEERGHPRPPKYINLPT